VRVPEAHDEDEAEAHGHHGVTDLNRREITVLAPIAVMCLVLGIYPAPVLDSLEAPVSRITAPAKAEAGVQPELANTPDEQNAPAPGPAAPALSALERKRSEQTTKFTDYNDSASEKDG
jgi:hypothetical protein